MKIHLPNSAFLGNIDSFFKSFDPSNPDSLEITANEKWISIHPVVLSMVASLALTVESEKIRCQQFTAKSKHYFARMGLFDFLKIDPKIAYSKHDPSGRFVCLTQVKNSNDLTRFITEMIPLLHLDKELRQAESIRYIVSELTRNVLEHASTKHGAVLCAQYYKKTNCIRIGIADAGVGVRKTISRSHAVRDDFDAIRLALMPGVTGTTPKEGGTEFNAGAGLFFIKSIASVNRNLFVVYSGNAAYKLLRKKAAEPPVLYADPHHDRHSGGNDFPYWSGTAVGIDISLNRSSEFGLLLDLIRNTYIKAVKERREKRSKKPKFI